MKRRLYFLLPSLQTSRKVYEELLLAHVPERNIHIVARDEAMLGDMPRAGLLQTSDIIHGTQLGFIIGGFTGALLGSLAATTGWIVPGMEVWSVVSITVGGAFLGSWTSSMVAINIPNSRLKNFQNDIAAGHLLFMVDVPASRVDEIRNRVKAHHPEADMRDIEPTMPAFP
ncbi:MAG: DUF1269 domain-containing protein [Gammaproteobacteria bacterium]